MLQRALLYYIFIQKSDKTSCLNKIKIILITYTVVINCIHGLVCNTFLTFLEESGTPDMVVVVAVVATIALIVILFLIVVIVVLARKGGVLCHFKTRLDPIPGKYAYFVTSHARLP